MVVYGIPVCTVSVYIVSMIDKSALRIRYEVFVPRLTSEAGIERGGGGEGGGVRRDRRGHSCDKLARSTIGRGLKDCGTPARSGERCHARAGAALG